MGGRYLITGVQLGMIKGMLLSGDTQTTLELLDVIEMDQFVGNSGKNVVEDTTSLQALDFFKEDLPDTEKA